MEMEGRRRRRSPASCQGRSRRQRRRAVEMALGRRKVRELRRLVPGAAPAMSADRLLLRTADYIVRLRARVELLRALSELITVTTNHAAGGIIGGGRHQDGDDASTSNNNL